MRPGAAARADLCSPWPREKSGGGLDAPRARAAGRAKASTERSANVEMSRGRFEWGVQVLRQHAASTRRPRQVSFRHQGSGEIGDGAAEMGKGNQRYRKLNLKYIK